jgi:hypothetical protein
MKNTNDGYDQIIPGKELRINIYELYNKNKMIMRKIKQIIKKM